MADWIAVLGDIPQVAIEQAVAERIRSLGRERPTPGEIRERALARVAMPELVRSDPAPFAPSVAPEAELDRRRAMVAQVAREFPMLKRMTRAGP